MKELQEHQQYKYFSEDGMSYKLICIDVDGTLLGENGIIPEENILAIEQAYK